VINTVIVTRAAERDLRKVPKHVQFNFFAWLDAVTQHGVEAVRKVPGFHDEPLSGKRFGQRSIRLSKGYRAFYEIEGATAKLVRVLEINKHKY
jgi:toxin HigB-1